MHVKTNTTGYADALICEAEGLESLRDGLQQAGVEALRIPEVVEADLAMTEMFGGFGAAFYRAYDRVYPRTEVYATKREIYNLYHYLNHYNLFGGGYLGGCERGLSALAALPAP